MTSNVLVPLPGFTLPADLPWRVRFIELVEEQLRRLHAAGGFCPPRFFAYYFLGEEPIAVTGSWTVTLDPDPLLIELPQELERLTAGRFAITAPDGGKPDFVLVHDRRDGACWLWRYAYGLRFVMASDPMLGDFDDFARRV